MYLSVDFKYGVRLHYVIAFSLTLIVCVFVQSEASVPLHCESALL